MSSFGENAPTLVSAFEDLFTPKIITTGQRPSESFIRNLAGHMIHPRSNLSGRVPLSMRNIERKFVEASKKEASDRVRLAEERKNRESNDEWKNWVRDTPTKKLSPFAISRLSPGTRKWYRQQLYEQGKYFKESMKVADLKRAWQVAFGLG